MAHIGGITDRRTVLITQDQDIEPHIGVSLGKVIGVQDGNTIHTPNSIHGEAIKQ